MARGVLSEPQSSDCAVGSQSDDCGSVFFTTSSEKHNERETIVSRLL